MQDKIAYETFINGFNCAQSVISAFAPNLGISRELSLKLATGLGAGVNYNGNTCGAVLGAYLILGLHYGVDKPGDDEGKQRFREKADRFTEEFLKSHNSINCKELLKADISNPEVLEKLREQNVFREICPKIVKKSATILENMLEGKL